MFENLFANPSPVYYLFYYIFYAIYFLFAWAFYIIIAILSITFGLLGYSISLIFYVTLVRMIYLLGIFVHKMCQQLSKEHLKTSKRPTSFPSPLLSSSPPPFQPTYSSKPDSPISVKESSTNMVVVVNDDDSDSDGSIDSTEVQFHRSLSDFESDYEVGKDLFRVVIIWCQIYPETGSVPYR